MYPAIVLLVSAPSIDYNWETNVILLFGSQVFMALGKLAKMADIEGGFGFCFSPDVKKQVTISTVIQLAKRKTILK